MRFQFHKFPAAATKLSLAVCLLLFSDRPLAQSLSIKRLDAKYWIEANVSSGVRHTLQVSDNLHLWVDIREIAQETNSFSLDDPEITQRYFRLKPSAEPAPPIRFLVIGDSTAADCCGWGAGLPTYFKANTTVVNYAQLYASSRTFLQSAELNQMLLIHPDFVLIQFALWDGESDPVRNTTPSEFAENLRTLVRMVRGFNGVPILMTFHALRFWDDQGKLIPSDLYYNSITRQVAVELNTPLIDLYPLTAALYSKLGPMGSEFMRFLPAGPDDPMHFSPLGAVYISQLIARAVPDSLGPYLTGIFDPLPVP